MPPRVTLGFISFNRLHYLRATLESARACIDYPNLEWIVSDGSSKEPGLREYLDGCDWIDTRIVRECTHADAMNEIVERATGDYVLIWPEDVQFVVKGKWLAGIVELLEANPWIGGVGLDALRRCTLRDWLKPNLWAQRWELWEELKRYGVHARRHRTLTSSDGVRLETVGWTMPGVVGSGIPSLTRTATWRELGPWRAVEAGHARLIDSSLGAEDDMVARFKASRRPLQQAILYKPVAADIINDATGCKAKVRKGIRYGEYWAPPEGELYYALREWGELPDGEDGLPLSFTELVRPLGWELPVGPDGERLKASINTEVSAPVVEDA